MKPMRNLTLFLAIVFALSLATVSAARAQATPTASNTLTNLPIVGTITGGGTLSGTLNVTQFVVQNGALAAVGTLTGTLTNAAGAVIGTVTQTVTAPLTIPSATCQILQLNIGAINLDLLGLNVNTSPISVDISATAAPGNLLGNLLCAVVHLLDNPAAPVNGLAGLLNNILSVLQGL